MVISMYEYIKGKVVNQESNYIVLDSNGIGYLIYVPNPYSFLVNKDYTVYVYQLIKYIGYMIEQNGERTTLV